MSKIQKAEIKIGWVKKTNNQIKKHYSQFTKEEYKRLREVVNNIDTRQMWSSVHLKTKKAITYSFEDVKNVMLDNNIIEYNLTKKNANTYDKRIVLRGKKEIITDKGRMNLCVVLSLKNMAIVTLYYNSSVVDTHQHLNMSRYNSNLKIEI